MGTYWVPHWNWNEADHREAERSGLGRTPCSVFKTGINRTRSVDVHLVHPESKLVQLESASRGYHHAVVAGLAGRRGVIVDF